MNLQSVSQWRQRFLDLDAAGRQRVLVIATGILVGLWLGDQIVVSPLTKAWTRRSEEIVRLRKQISDAEDLLRRERGANSNRERWQRIQTNALPASVSQAEGRMLGAFENWSRESQISILSVKPQWKRSGDDYSSLECRVDASGSLSAITRFLHEIEKDDLAIKVDVVELNARDNTGAQITLGLQVNGLVLSPN